MFMVIINALVMYFDASNKKRLSLVIKKISNQINLLARFGAFNYFLVAIILSQRLPASIMLPCKQTKTSNC